MARSKVNLNAILTDLLPHVQALLEGRDPRREKEQERKRKHYQTEEGKKANRESTRKWRRTGKGKAYHRAYMAAYMQIPEKRELYRAAWRRYTAKKQRTRDKDPEIMDRQRTYMRVYMRVRRAIAKARKNMDSGGYRGRQVSPPLPPALSSPRALGGYESMREAL